MPDLHSFPGTNLLNHTAPRLQNNSSSNPHSQHPSFPVSVIQNRESSPTKSIYGTSPTGSLSIGVGRRSPIHDIPMDSIAEVCTEESSTPTEVNAPVSIAMVVNNHSPPGSHINRLRRASLGDRGTAAITAALVTPQAQQQSTSRPTTPSGLNSGGSGDLRRRRSGAISPALQEQIQASFQDQPPVEQLPNTLRDVLQNGRNHMYQPVVSDSSQLSSKVNPMSRGLMGMLQTPLPSNSVTGHVASQIHENGGHGIHMVNHTPSSQSQYQPGSGLPLQTSYLYANALNHYNSHLSGTTAFQAVMPTHPMNSPFYHHPHHHHQAPPPMAPHPQNNVQDVLSHVSSVLNHCGIQYHHNNGVFAVDHQGVRLHILVCHLASQQNAIQLQYVAGDASQYQTLCSHLYSRLTATTLAAQ